ncbi:MAG: hypothetical protein LBF68_03260 [Christensenellaceae bacterium]|nr:hypothetical protein [Christensenellaceae bacterium]
MHRTIKEYLENNSDIDSKDIPIIRRVNGKPTIESPPYISLSHSRNITVCIVAFRPVGIDVQFMKQLNYVQMSKRYFSNIIKDEIEFYKYWTAAEAKAKCTDEFLPKVLKNGNFDDCKRLDFIDNYVLTICTKDDSSTIFFNMDENKYLDPNMPFSSQSSLMR